MNETMLTPVVAVDLETGIGNRRQWVRETGLKSFEAHLKKLSFPYQIVGRGYFDGENYYTDLTMTERFV